MSRAQQLPAPVVVLHDRNSGLYAYFDGGDEMSYLLFLPLSLVMVVVLYFAFWRVFERYAPDDGLEQECIDLLKKANKGMK